MQMDGSLGLQRVWSPSQDEVLMTNTFLSPVHRDVPEAISNSHPVSQDSVAPRFDDFTLQFSEVPAFDSIDPLLNTRPRSPSPGVDSFLDLLLLPDQHHHGAQEAKRQAEHGNSLLQEEAGGFRGFDLAQDIIKEPLEDEQVSHTCAHSSHCSLPAEIAEAGVDPEPQSSSESFLSAFPTRTGTLNNTGFLLEGIKPPHQATPSVSEELDFAEAGDKYSNVAFQRENQTDVNMLPPVQLEVDPLSISSGDHFSPSVHLPKLSINNPVQGIRDGTSPEDYTKAPGTFSPGPSYTSSLNSSNGVTSSLNCTSSRTSVGPHGKSVAMPEFKEDWRESLKKAVRAKVPALVAAEGRHKRLGFEAPGSLAARLSVVVDNLASRKPAQRATLPLQQDQGLMPEGKPKQRGGFAGKGKGASQARFLGLVVREKLNSLKDKQIQGKRRPASELASPLPTTETSFVEEVDCQGGLERSRETGYQSRGKQLCVRRNAAHNSMLDHLKTGFKYETENKSSILGVPLHSRSFLCVSPQLGSIPVEQVRMWDPELLRGVSSQLLDLATAYTCHDLAKAEDTREWLQVLASPVGSVPQRLSFYVLSALDRRFKGQNSRINSSLELIHPVPHGPAPLMEYAKEGIQRIWGTFQEIVMTNTLIDALKGHKSIHILVLTACSTPSWDDLFAALASHRKGKPEKVRITILIPELGPTAVPGIKQEFVHLGQQALSSAKRLLGIEAQCLQVMFVPADFRPWEVVTIVPGEALGVAAWLALATFPDSSVLRHNPRDSLLKWIREQSPKVMTILDCDSDFNSPFFIPRFQAAVKGIEILLENFEQTVYPSSTDLTRAADLSLEELFVLDFMNCVSCEGLQRYERSERLDKWRHRLKNLGYTEQAFGDEMFETLRGATSHRRFSVVDDKGLASLRWDGIPLVFAGSWKVL